MGVPYVHPLFGTCAVTGMYSSWTAKHDIDNVHTHVSPRMCVHMTVHVASIGSSDFACTVHCLCITTVIFFEAQ